MAPAGPEFATKYYKLYALITKPVTGPKIAVRDTKKKSNTAIERNFGPRDKRN